MTAILTTEKMVGLPLDWSNAALLLFKKCCVSLWVLVV
jgi:hypothetical protein